jgi:hypothetical protein
MVGAWSPFSLHAHLSSLEHERRQPSLGADSHHSRATRTGWAARVEWWSCKWGQGKRVFRHGKAPAMVGALARFGLGGEAAADEAGEAQHAGTEQGDAGGLGGDGDGYAGGADELEAGDSGRGGGEREGSGGGVEAGLGEGASSGEGEGGSVRIGADFVAEEIGDGEDKGLTEEVGDGEEVGVGGVGEAEAGERGDVVGGEAAELDGGEGAHGSGGLVDGSGGGAEADLGVVEGVVSRYGHGAGDGRSRRDGRGGKQNEGGDAGSDAQREIS